MGRMKEYSMDLEQRLERVEQEVSDMRRALDWFDGLAPNHMLWAVGVWALAMTVFVLTAHFWIGV